MDFFALALVMSNSRETPATFRWTRLALAGLAVGINVMEAADIGAIFSMMVAAFVFYKNMVEAGGSAAAKIIRGVGQITMIRSLPDSLPRKPWFHWSAPKSRVSRARARTRKPRPSIGTGPPNGASPKLETLSLIVPGLFGYRMDTPKNMMEFLQNSYKGGNYWGGVGRDPMLDAYLDGRNSGPMPQGFMRFTGGGRLCRHPRRAGGVLGRGPVTAETG